MKLSFWTIIIMAISVAFGIMAFAIFHQTIPTLTAAKNYADYKESLQREADKAPQAKRRVERAMRASQAKADAWNAYAATRTPENDVSRGGINLAVNPVQLTVDTQKFRNSIQRAVNDQVKKGGIKVVQGPAVPGPKDTDNPQALLTDFYNYPSPLRFPVVIFNFGTITVTGTYAQIEANVRSYKSMPHYLAVTDGLQITGTSPNLTGTYTLSVVGFIRGKDIFPSALSKAAAPAAPATAGFGGGPPAGMPPSGFAGGGRGAGPVSAGGPGR